MSMFKSGSGDKLVRYSSKIGKPANSFFSFSSQQKEPVPPDIFVWYGFACSEPPAYLLEEKLNIIKSPNPVNDRGYEYIIGIEIYKVQLWKPQKHLETGNIQNDQLLWEQQRIMNLKEPLVYYHISPSTTPYVVIIPEYLSLASSGCNSTLEEED